MYIVEKFLDQEKTSFKVFNEFMATRVLEAAFKSISRALQIGLKKKDTAEVVVPWGTFTAERRIRNNGDSANTNVSYEPSKAFLEALNGDGKDRDAYYQDDFNETMMDAFAEYVSYGMFDTNAPENKEKLATLQKGLFLKDNEKEYFMNRIATLLLTIGREKQRDGKQFRLEVDQNFGHGYYDFEYDDDKIAVRFTADKAFKQFVKNDDVTGGGMEE